MTPKIISFRDLDIWNLGKTIVMDTYRLTQRFPKDEWYGFVAQMRRAALSIPSNIAEGFARYHNKEERQFLYVALGSCAELETQLEISGDLGYGDATLRTKLLEHLNHEARMLRSLIKKL
ncbi:MAG: four helix bundle protein [Candidatus Omnitrophica bacterium]|nr:four helix bundle protein [Candidatus Omnitrophota bacterium]